MQTKAIERKVYDQETRSDVHVVVVGCGLAESECKRLLDCKPVVGWVGTKKLMLWCATRSILESPESARGNSDICVVLNPRQVSTIAKTNRAISYHITPQLHAVFHCVDRCRTDDALKRHLMFLDDRVVIG